jgi:chorismate mutase
MNMLAERLRSIDKSISLLTAERLKVLAEIAKIDAEDGASERQTASRVARLTSSTPKQAAGEVAMAKQVAALPGVADAFAKGEISSGQLGAVAAIASASSEGEALALAKTGTSSQLHQRAAASRGKLFEERCKAQKSRYLAFKPEEDGQSTRIHGRLPFAESKHLEMQLRKIADRLGLCDKERPSPSARMADALLILTKNNPSQALHDHEEQANQQSGQANDPATTPNDESTRSAASATESATRPKLYALTSPPGSKPKPVIDYDEEPFPETDSNTADFSDTSEDAEHEDSGGAKTKSNQPGNDLAWEESNSEDSDGAHARND